MQIKTKLTIGPLPEQADDYSQYEESVIRWDRIISFGVISALMLGIIIFYVFSSREMPTSEVAKIKGGAVLSLPESKLLEVNTNKPSAYPSTDLPSEESKVNAVGQVITGDQKTLTIGDEVKESHDVHVTKGVQNTQVLKDVNEKKIESPNVAVVGLSKEQTLAKAALSELQKFEVDLNRQPAEVLIVNSGISRAVLTTRLEEQNPGEPLAAQVVLPTEGIMKVILFTEMRGIRGKTLYHEWYREGVRQARVKIPVNVDPQRSYSSKYINHQMLGKWQVKVLDEQSEPYILTDFEVSSH